MFCVHNFSHEVQSKPLCLLTLVAQVSKRSKRVRLIDLPNHSTPLRARLIQSGNTQKSTIGQTRSVFGGVQEFSGGCVLWYVSSPYTLCNSPHIMAQILKSLRTGCDLNRCEPRTAIQDIHHPGTNLFMQLCFFGDCVLKCSQLQLQFLIFEELIIIQSSSSR